MKIALSGIPEDGIQRTFSIDEQSFEKLFLEAPRGFSLREAQVVCSISRVGERVYIKGELNAALIVECSRCLSLMVAKTADAFAYIFVPAPKHWESETELSAEEMDEVFYDGDTINLAEVVVEQINLLVPLRALCRDDCQGLCPICGKNKNEGSCSCEAPLGKEGFVALKGLKIG